jgi:glucokinase
MTVLVADVGGTNARLAMVEADGTMRAVSRFRNDDFASFAALLTAYAAEWDQPPLAGFCAAVAGPVTSDTARLTNRDWNFDKDEIAACLPGLSRSSVRLINDLAALGHALPALGQLQLDEIKPAAPDAAANDQALVVGLGTGVNICLAKGCEKGVVVIEAELGHASLPVSVFEPLQAVIGSASATFPTIEELFAGRGLSRLYHVLSGGKERAGQDILAAYEAGKGGTVAETVDLLAGLLGRFTRELVYLYQPFGGVHFAGGVARGLLGSSARAGFLHAFDVPGRFAEQSGRVPLRLITDDAAALTGAAQLFSGTGSTRDTYTNGSSA